jgi:hypothetical protein
VKKFITVVVIFCSTCFGQDTTKVEGYTASESVALVTMTGIIIPMAIAGTVVSAVPPSVSFVFINGVAYTGLNFETGFGFGEKRETGVFSDWRLGLSYSYIVNSKVRDLFRVELKRDIHFDFVDRRKIFLSGFHLSGGLITDFPNYGYTFGTGLWVKSPWLSFFGFMPQHTYGLTYRYNKYFKEQEFSEISLGVTSAFTF